MKNWAEKPPAEAGQGVVSGGRFFSTSDFALIRFYRVDEPKEILTLPVKVDSKLVRVRHISNDGARILVQWDSILLFIDVSSGTVRKLGEKQIALFDVSPDGKWVVSSGDKKFQVFSVTGEPAATVAGAADPAVLDPETGNEIPASAKTEGPK